MTGVLTTVKYRNPPPCYTTPSVAPSTVESGGILAHPIAMSTTQHPESDTCSYCGDDFPLPNARPNHCDEKCYLRDKGERALSQIQSDHRICSTCYGQVKQVEPAKPHWTRGPDHPNRTDTGPKEISDGFQYATDRTTWGVDEWAIDPYLKTEGTRWSCVCGAVNPNEEIGMIQAVDIPEAIVNLYSALQDAYDRGAIANRPKKEPFLDAFRPPWRGVEYAVGVAIQ